MPARSVSRVEPPRCPYNNNFADRRHPDGLTWATCPICVAHSQWAAAIRKDDIAAGRRTPSNKRGGNGHLGRNPELLKPVPKCGARDRHGRAGAKDCPRCKARLAHIAALRRRDRSLGIDLNMKIDPKPVIAHCKKLLASGHTRQSIADESGVHIQSVREIIRGARAHVLKLNADALLAVQPFEYPTFGRVGELNATKTTRILRGLATQAWTFGYMASLLNTSRQNLARLSEPGTKVAFVTTKIAEQVEGLADKLGPFDIAELDEPMDGMSRATAARAARNGWCVLADWDGLDMADPRVQPHGYDDAATAASNGLVLVDAGKVELALDFHPLTITGAGDREALTVDRFTKPITKMELYEIVRAGSERDHAGVVRYSANLLAQRLGVAERTVQRIRTEIATADWLLDAGPTLTAALTATALILDSNGPGVLRLSAAVNLLSRYPIAGWGFYNSLVILGATQPRPYGRGRSDADVADWLGCAEQDATDLRTRAVLAARQYQDIRPGVSSRPRKLGTNLSAVA